MWFDEVRSNSARAGVLNSYRAGLAKKRARTSADNRLRLRTVRNNEAAAII